ncbi:MAG TPA: GtrA family protein [Streptosporangiaceae bacterium]|jgi:putative flippase GtrA|nr:GtrA family protein [Streptosporangiaceae bacterium]
MAITSNRLGETLTRKVRTTLGIRFGRFAVAAIAAFATTEVVLTICAGPLALTATWASIIAWFSGALVSYVLSRWAWKRKGRPNLLKETLPFWIVSAMVIVILTLATKFAYHSAGWLNLTGAERVLYVDLVYGVANIGTFLLRFLFFHYVLFAGSPGRPGPAAAEEALASTDPGPEIFAARATDPGDAEDSDRPPDADRER